MRAYKICLVSIINSVYELIFTGEEFNSKQEAENYLKNKDNNGYAGVELTILEVYR